MLELADPGRRRRKPERSRELLDAALAVFVDRGFAAARTEEIAARAGVSKGTLYFYFNSKEDLLRTLIAEGFSSRIEVRVDQMATSAVASSELLRQALTAWQASLAESQAGGIFKLVLTEARHFPGLADCWNREVMGPVRALVSHILLRGIERGEFRAFDVDLAAHALILPIVMACLYRHTMGALVPDDFLMHTPDLLGRHIELVLDGLYLHSDCGREGDAPSTGT
ncbi:TetR/AcrR family transcriptional regulator [Hydrogenophaga sp.]|uniref:TetR/AcrR family transcriptional regulator n=1 Tax=Hydrogenophaga sp. TaxID=1904254 RepID=UPI0025BFB159|nr:TetR/AcrR family transcriptional regulator [Hydrogenophaga sp.]MBT9464801.1 TetR/AcrR family transcriptional regulator [Hydrogenophaga sp.]